MGLGKVSSSFVSIFGLRVHQEDQGPSPVLSVVRSGWHQAQCAHPTSVERSPWASEGLMVIMGVAIASQEGTHGAVGEHTVGWFEVVGSD